MSNPSLETLQYYRDDHSDKFGWVKAPIRVIEETCKAIEKLEEQNRAAKVLLESKDETIRQLTEERSAQWRAAKATDPRFMSIDQINEAISALEKELRSRDGNTEPRP
jgi:predicted RNase H-like nuclease (RuvC/YqgF family)